MWNRNLMYMNIMNRRKQKYDKIVVNIRKEIEEVRSGQVGLDTHPTKIFKKVLEACACSILCYC